MKTITLIRGDCVDILRTLQDNSIDSVVTDPPYGISFMNKHWDYDVPKVEVWQEVFRVLKPGGHILCACGTRTQHRMTVNIEDAGFEIRDVVAWIYGSGFPKSLNIGKAVDKEQGNERSVISIRTNGNKGGGVNTFDDDNYVWDKPFEETKGNSEYEGWGTALKPAMELWTLARKPLSEKTVATNVLKYGTGGINIDGCRVETDETITNHSRGSESAISKGKYGDSAAQETHQTKGQQQGRFPANVIHDGSDEVRECFPETKSGNISPHHGKRQSDPSIFGMQFTTDNWHGNSGNASRFFYTAKASKSERNKGCDELPSKQVAYGNQQTAQLKRGEELTPNAGVGDGGVISPQKNSHPTVKPISLMRYLCRMITPKNGTILDPYMGSGSTGIGAKVEGFNFIGIEREADYCKIAQARIDAWEDEAPPKPKIIEPTLF